LRLILIGLLAVAAHGQTEWREMAGDDPRWAQPGFDDSAWKLTKGPQRTTASEPWISGVRWYRATFPVSPEWKDRSLALGVGPLNHAYEVFIEGIKAGSFGSWEPRPVFYVERDLSFAVAPGAVTGPIAHVAIRRWTWGARMDFAILQSFTLPVSQRSANTAGDGHPPEFGLAESLQPKEELHVLQGLRANVFGILAHLLTLACGLICLALFRAQRNRAEYLWLGITLALMGGLPILGSPAGLTESFPQLSVYPLALIFLYYGLSVPTYFFLAEIAPPFRRFLRFWGLALAVLGPVVIFSLISGNAALQTRMIQIRTFGNFLGIFPALAVSWYSLREKRLDSVALPLGLVVRWTLEFWRIEIAVFFSGPGARSISAGIFRIDPRDIADVAFACIMLGVLWVRYQREQRRQVEVEGELAAARQVQRLLLGGGTVETPGFAVTAVYRPAQETGGDFYQVLPREDGSLLLLVGDVSGKGLQAAMLVATVLGALRNEWRRSPSDLPGYLNEALVGHTGGGFVTCCCALFNRDGRVEIANAGHLPPYLGAKEMDVETGIPLGLSAAAAYGETTLQLGDGSMTLLSDGVVEARNAKGELLGFARTCELSAKAAGEVADAAQAFGQNDDITVVTVARLRMANHAA
jgi:sigma-B regulation protein RsbU (phosphoserine phosphatase)